MAGLAAVVVALTLAACGSPASSGPSVHWVELHSAVAPAPRAEAGGAYDSATRTLYVVGGNDNYRAVNGFWGWDGRTWTEEPSPPPLAARRSKASIAFDATNDTLVVYGGFVSARTPKPWIAFRDTWVWNGSSWSDRSTGPHPPFASGGNMVFDGASGEVVLFGGLAQKEPVGTWLWNGTEWAKAHPAVSPPPRTDAAMAYDPATKSVVLFSGLQLTGVTNNDQVVADTWVWNGSDWRRVAAGGPEPPPHRWASMAYDPQFGGVVLVGGRGATGKLLSGVWLWNGHRWRELHVSGPPLLRTAATVAYVPADHGVVVFGGAGRRSTSSTTWVLRST